MREERDVVGEKMLSDECLFGIGTARLLDALPSVGPEYPVDFATAVVRIRKAQAVGWGAEGIWDGAFVGLFIRAADRLLNELELLTQQIRVRPIQDVSGRALIGNVDEVLANLILLEQGGTVGDYFRVAPLFHLDTGVRHAEVFAAAARFTIQGQNAQLVKVLDELIEVLSQRKEEVGQKLGLCRLQYQTIALRAAHTQWCACEADVRRARDALERLRQEFPVYWEGGAKTISLLRKETDLEIEGKGPEQDLLCEADYYQRVGNELSALLCRMVQLSQYCRMMVECNREVDWPRIRGTDALNPGYMEPLYPDYVTQASLLAHAGLGVIAQARMQSVGELDAYLPVIAVEIYQTVQIACAVCRLVGSEWLPHLQTDSVSQRARLQTSPLHAERLISVIGFDRAVQVARMAALTGKSVRNVAEKMKMLTPEQLVTLFPIEDSWE